MEIERLILINFGQRIQILVEGTYKDAQSVLDKAVEGITQPASE